MYNEFQYYAGVGMHTRDEVRLTDLAGCAG
jgi:hypothetical protein